jgi:hypothetical protein
MANPQVILQLSLNYFQRNNPVEAILMNALSTITYLKTFQSQRKLLKFRMMLFQQQVSSIEQKIHEGGDYTLRGTKLNKSY